MNNKIYTARIGYLRCICSYFLCVEYMLAYMPGIFPVQSNLLTWKNRNTVPGMCQRMNHMQKVGTYVAHIHDSGYVAGDSLLKGIALESPCSKMKVFVQEWKVLVQEWKFIYWTSTFQFNPWHMECPAWFSDIFIKCVHSPNRHDTLPVAPVGPGRPGNPVAPVGPGGPTTKSKNK